MPRIVLIVLVALALSLGGPLAPAAHAATTDCTSHLTLTTINGSLVVPAGQACRLSNVTVTGNVKVESGATIAIVNTILPLRVIAGNVKVESGATISMINANINGTLIATDAAGVFTPAGRTTINGSLTISGGSTTRLHDLVVNGAVNLTGLQGTGDGALRVVVSHFGDKLTVTDSAEVIIQESHIEGKTTVDDNASVHIDTTDIGGKLTCSGNGVVTGSGNTAVGGMLGQCSSL
jgi:hypothetical protein